MAGLPVQQEAAMTGGEQDLVVWKPTQAPRQHSVQYMLRKALLLRAPLRTFAQMFSPPSANSAFLHARISWPVMMFSRRLSSRTPVSFRQGVLAGAHGDGQQ